MLTPRDSIDTLPQIQNRGKYTASKQALNERRVRF